MYRLTRETSAGFAQHLNLYPASLASFADSELESQPRLTALSKPLCETLLVPTPPAVYASLLRMMRSYPRYSPTRVTLESDLSELIGYNLYQLMDGYVDTDDEELCEELEVDQRVEDAVRTVQEWRRDGRVRDEDEWIAEVLEDVVSGKRDIEDIPWATEQSKL